MYGVFCVGAAVYGVYFVYFALVGSIAQSSRDQSVRKNRPVNPVFTPPPPPDTPPPPEEDDLELSHNILRSFEGQKLKSHVNVTDSSTQVHVTPRDSLSSGKRTSL